ncbi:hypothetical protein RA271_27505, partial [Pseudomonas syringae pv. tagetis]
MGFWFVVCWGVCGCVCGFGFCGGGWVVGVGGVFLVFVVFVFVVVVRLFFWWFVGCVGGFVFVLGVVCFGWLGVVCGWCVWVCWGFVGVVLVLGGGLVVWVLVLCVGFV